MKDTRHPSFMRRISAIILLLAGLCTGPALLASPHVKIATIWAYGDTVTHARTLETKQNNLRFYCTTLENIPADSIEFEFMLEGHETQWQPAFADGWYFYTDLPPGEYVFHARCRYPRQSWGPVLSHSFTILCPWWRTGWAYFLYAICALSLLMYIFHLIRERIRLHNQLQIEQAESLFRYQFVIQASRDFRTPLTVIRSTIEKLNAQKDNSFTRTDIQHLKQSSRQLMQMVENLLEYRRTDAKLTTDANEVLEMTDVPMNNRRVAVVETDAVLADMIRRELLKYMQVEILSDEQQVAESVRKLAPEVVVIDTQMTEASPYDLLHEIKKQMHIPVILLSDFDNKHSLIRAIHSEADDYLSKPFSCEVLSAMIFRHLKRYDAMLKKEQGYIATELPSSESTEKNTSPQAPLIEKRTDKRFLENLEWQIRSHLSEVDFDVNALAESMKMSRSQLGQKIKALYGMTSVEYLRDQRLNHAARLLADTDQTVQEIMFQAGMQDTTNFYRRFKEKFGVSPSQYRQQDHSE